MKKRLFRWHRGGLGESMGTTIQVHSKADMISYILKDFPADNYLQNIRISEERLDNSFRVGQDCKEYYRVLADFEGYTGQCIGYCNFNEDPTPQELLEAAIILATEKHAGQVDKGGMPYILHPLRVMISVQKEFIEHSKKYSYWGMCIAAVLHDVIEDTNTTIEELSNYGFYKESLNIIQILTKKEGEDYQDYIQRIRDSCNFQAIAIKIADLKDNMDLSRLENPLKESDNLRLEKYNLSMEKLQMIFWRKDPFKV